MFALDPRLEAGSIFLADLHLCQARLQADMRWPWIVLVPRRVGPRELEDLTSEDRSVLLGEMLAAGHAVREMGRAAGRNVEKLNVGALGNIVAQLHVHIVGRRSDDPAWPGPVWGFGAPKAYLANELETALAAARTVLQV